MFKFFKDFIILLNASISCIVLNAPQAGQRPIHWWVSFPQAVQKNTVFALAMALPSFALLGHYTTPDQCGQVFER